LDLTELPTAAIEVAVGISHQTVWIHNCRTDGRRQTIRIAAMCQQADRIAALDVASAQPDVENYIRNHCALAVWSRECFHDVASQIEVA